MRVENKITEMNKTGQEVMSTVCKRTGKKIEAEDVENSHTEQGKRVRVERNKQGFGKKRTSWRKESGSKVEFGHKSTGKNVEFADRRMLDKDLVVEHRVQNIARVADTVLINMTSTDIYTYNTHLY